jgi:hypothetical protein
MKFVNCSTAARKNLLIQFFFLLAAALSSRAFGFVFLFGSRDVSPVMEHEAKQLLKFSDKQINILGA